MTAIPAIRALFALSLVACSSPPRSEPEWQACTADADCVMVATSCCACSAGDYAGIHQRFRAQAIERLTPTSCERCPSMDCPRHFSVCRAGHCQVVDD